MEETTIYVFDNAGANLGILPYDSAEHVEDLDGTDKLTVTTERWVSKRDRLVWQDNAGDWHEHMADNPRRSHAGSRAATKISCSNSISELYGAQASGTKLKGSVQSILAALLEGTRWTAGSCSDFGTVELEVWHKNVRECIAELCEQVGGETATEIVMGATAVSSRTVRIVEQRGATTVRRQFSYGRNIGSASREIGADEVYTRIVGYGAKLDKDDDSEYAERITTAVDTGADLERWGIPNGDGTFSHNVMTYTDNACTSKAFLTKQCTQMAKVYGRPVVCYTFDISEVDDELWRDVRLGNMVMCVDDSFNPTMELTERVSRIKRRLKGRISCTVEIGRRSNPLVERFRAVEKTAKKTTGNGSRVGGYGGISTGGEYSGGSFQASVESMPTSMKITTPPTKTVYYAGAPMDYTGIVCTLYDATGQVYADEWYPDGIVPFNELIFPVEFAIQGGGDAPDEYVLAANSGSAVVNGHELGSVQYAEIKLDKATRNLDGTLKEPPKFMAGQYEDVTYGGGEYTGPFYVQNQSTSTEAQLRITSLQVLDGGVMKDTFLAVLVPGVEQTRRVYLSYGQQEDWNDRLNSSLQVFSVFLEDNTANFSYSEYTGDRITSFVAQCSPCEEGAIRSYLEALAWYIAYGGDFDRTKIDNKNIPVRWARSDGEQLSDTFPITVNGGGPWGGGDGENPSSSGGGDF